MKTKKWILTIIAASLITVGFAAGKTKVNVSAIENEKAFVSYNSETPSIIEFTIKDERGGTVYYYKSKENRTSYRGKFDFSKVENGDYHLNLTSNDASLSSKVTVSHKGIQVYPAVEMPDPVFNHKKDLLDISFLNVPQEEVYLNLYKNGVHVAYIELGKEMCIQKRINLANLEEGEYKVVINDLFKEHTYMVSM